MTMLFFYWLQRITDIKWLYHVLLPICLFFAYFTCRVLYAEWKTEDSLKNVVLHILKKKQMGCFLCDCHGAVYHSIFEWQTV